MATANINKNSKALLNGPTNQTITRNNIFENLVKGPNSAPSNGNKSLSFGSLSEPNSRNNILGVSMGPNSSSSGGSSISSGPNNKSIGSNSIFGGNSSEKAVNSDLNTGGTDKQNTNNTSKKNNTNTKINNQPSENNSFFKSLFNSNKTQNDTSGPKSNDNQSAANNESSNHGNSIFNDIKSTVSNVANSVKTTSSAVAENLSDRMEDLTEDKESMLFTVLKIVIVLLVILAIFYVARYLLNKYQDTMYSSPYLLEGTKNGKHALVISQDPANPSYIPMPKSEGQDGIQFTYDFWLMIENFEYKSGEWKHLFHKGNASSYPNRAPGVWIHPKTNALRVYMNTQDNILEHVDITNVPIRKWLHVAVVLDDANMDVYVNGYLKTRKLLTSVPKLNNGDFWCNMFGGFEGYLAKIRYYARAITASEIAENVRNGPGNSACIDTGQVPPYLDDDWWLS
jgi:hypothetical protein